MTQPAATLLVALFDHVVCIKVAGRANFTSSVDLKKVVSELSERGYNRFMIDLSECLMMDSTFLGVLAGIGLKFAAPNNGEPVLLLNPPPRIADLLENLGVSHLFNISNTAAPEGQRFEPVSPEGEKASRTEVTRTCLEAHCLLMDLNPDNVQKFKDVARFLAEDLKKLEAVEK